MKIILKCILAGWLISVFTLACQGKKSEAASTDGSSTTASSGTPAAATPVPAADNAAGKKTFETYCILCHGADGKLGLNGSKDLTISERPLAERIEQVTNGKGLMTPFKDILTEAEIKAVAEYSLSLKK